MDNVVEYKTVLGYAGQSMQFDSEINRNLQQGWQLYGPFVASDGRLYQPMVKIKIKL